MYLWEGRTVLLLTKWIAQTWATFTYCLLITYNSSMKKTISSKPAIYMPCTCSFTRPAKGQFLLPLKSMAELPLTSVVQGQGLYALIRILVALCDIKQTEWKTYQRSAPYTPSQRKSSAQETSRSFLLQRELRNHIKLFKKEKCWKYSLGGSIHTYTW